MAFDIASAKPINKPKFDIASAKTIEQIKPAFDMESAKAVEKPKFDIESARPLNIAVDMLTSPFKKLADITTAENKPKDVPKELTPLEQINVDKQGLEYDPIIETVAFPAKAVANKLLTVGGLAIYEGLMQGKNYIISKAKDKDYDPFSPENFSSLLPEKTPALLKVASNVAEMVVDAVASGKLEGATKNLLVKNTVDTFANKVAKAGYKPEVVEKARQSVKDMIVAKETGILPKVEGQTTTDIMTTYKPQPTNIDEAMKMNIQARTAKIPPAVKTEPINVTPKTEPITPKQLDINIDVSKYTNKEQFTNDEMKKIFTQSEIASGDLGLNGVVGSKRIMLEKLYEYYKTGKVPKPFKSVDDLKSQSVWVDKLYNQEKFGIKPVSEQNAQITIVPNQSTTPTSNIETPAVAQNNQNLEQTAELNRISDVVESLGRENLTPEIIKDLDLSKQYINNPNVDLKEVEKIQNKLQRVLDDIDNAKSMMEEDFRTEQFKQNYGTNIGNKSISSIMKDMVSAEIPEWNVMKIPNIGEYNDLPIEIKKAFFSENATRTWDEVEELLERQGIEIGLFDYLGQKYQNANKIIKSGKYDSKIYKRQQELEDLKLKYPKLAELLNKLKINPTTLEKGAIRGYKLGDVVARQETRRNLIESFKKQNIDIAKSKEAIVNYAKENLPLIERGKLIMLIKNAKNQKDVAKAFVRIDKRVSEVQVKDAINNLKNIVDKTVDSNAISADYRNKIKDIISNYELVGHTQKTLSRIQATQDYINRQRTNGINVELPQRIIDKLAILTRTPKEDLTLEQVQSIQDEIELLALQGKTKWNSKQALYENEKELRKNELLKTAKPINSIQLEKTGLGKSQSSFSKSYTNTRNWLQLTKVGVTPIQAVSEITGIEKMTDVLFEDFRKYLVSNDSTIDKWYKLTKDFNEKNYKRIGAYAISKQKNGVQLLLNNGVPIEDINGLVLTPKEQTAYKFVRNVFVSEFPKVKKYALDIYNKDVGQVDNYVSFMADNTRMNELNIWDKFANAQKNSMKTKTVEQGFTEKRSDGADYEIETNIDKIFRRHIDDVAYMLTMGKDIKQYFEIINSPEMREKLGDVGTLAWLKYLDLLARKGGSGGASAIKLLDTIRKNMAVGVLGFRITSAFVQLVSSTDLAGTIGGFWVSKGLSTISTSRTARNFVMDNFPEVRKAVGDDIAFREFGEGFMGGLSRKSMKPLQVLDGFMRSVSVVSSYIKFATEKGIPIDFKNPDKQTIQEINKILQQSQGSSFFVHQPLALTTGLGLTGNRSVNKTILTFMSFSLFRWANIERQIWRLGIQQKKYGKAFMSFLWMIIVASAMEETIRRGTKRGIDKITEMITNKESQKTRDSFIVSSVMNAVQSIPIIGSVVSSMDYGTNPVPFINTAEQILKGGKKVYSGKKSQTKLRGAITAIGGLGTLFGIPASSQISQLVKGLVPPVNAKKIHKRYNVR